MNDRYDIVVIGSGIGGLVSAALLSKAGKKVLIIEKEPKPGGYLTEFRTDDFVFDVSLHLLNGCNKGGYVYDIFRKCGILEDIKFIKPKYLYRSVFPGLDIRIPQAGMKEHKETLIKYFPESKKGIEAFFTDMPKVFSEVSGAGNSSPITPMLSSYLRNSAEHVMNKYISDERLKAVICQLWMYFGLPPSKLRAMDFCYPWVDYSQNGGYYPEKGSYAITRALVNRIKKNGGKFVFGKEADRIMIENGICNGVGMGGRETACDAVIVNSDLQKTIYNLIGQKVLTPASYAKLENIEPSISAVEIFMGLDVDLNDKYPDEFEIFVNSTYDIDEQYRQSIDNEAEKAPFAIGIYSNVNRFAAPKGKSAVTIVMLSGYKYWVSLSQKEYGNAKERISGILIKRASKIIPEMSTHLKKKIVATPITFKRYTNNSEGSIYGYVRTRQGKIEIRPNESSGIKNLYFASAWARQGSGVMKVLRCAEDVVKKITVAERNGVFAK